MCFAMIPAFGFELEGSSGTGVQSANESGEESALRSVLESAFSSPEDSETSFLSRPKSVFKFRISTPEGKTMTFCKQGHFDPAHPIALLHEYFRVSRDYAELKTRLEDWYLERGVGLWPEFKKAFAIEDRGKQLSTRLLHGDSFKCADVRLRRKTDRIWRPLPERNPVKAGTREVQKESEEKDPKESKEPKLKERVAWRLFPKTDVLKDTERQLKKKLLGAYIKVTPCVYVGRKVIFIGEHALPDSVKHFGALSAELRLAAARKDIRSCLKQTWYAFSRESVDFGGLSPVLVPEETEAKDEHIDRKIRVLFKEAEGINGSSGYFAKTPRAVAHPTDAAFWVLCRGGAKSETPGVSIFQIGYSDRDAAGVCLREIAEDFKECTFAGVQKASFFSPRSLCSANHAESPLLISSANVLESCLGDVSSNLRKERMERARPQTATTSASTMDDASDLSFRGEGSGSGIGEETGELVGAHRV